MLPDRRYHSRVMTYSMPPGTQLSLFSPGSAGSPWPVRRSARARRLSARVFIDGRVEIVAPVRATAGRIQDFIDRHRQWIEKRSGEAGAAAASIEQPFPPAAIDLAAFGERWQLRSTEGPSRLRIVAPGVLEAGAGPTGRAGLQPQLLAWLVGHVRQRLGDALREAAQQHGFSFSRLELRRQRTRWGSCSVRGTISLNVCIAFQRPEVMQYLLVHELAHTRHMNHSPAFWACVASCCPDWQSCDRELLQGWRHVPGWVFR
jgi:predicted metal-dependent hydrolase